MDISLLKTVLPVGIFDEFPLCGEKFNINTSLRIAHFLAQCAHESGNFKVVYENLYYTSNRLCVVWPSLFNASNAGPYNMNPQLIANKVYANRMGNGNEASGDGYKFRGRGNIQLTGKNNYLAFNQHVPEKIMLYPDLVATKYPLLSASFFFDKNGLNTIADKGATPDIVRAITLKVNGGVNGLAEREAYFNKFYNLLNPIS
jgi:putative chitinase